MVSSPTLQVNERVVKDGLQHGSSPLDFINKNLRTPQTPVVADPVNIPQVAAKPTEPQVEAKTDYPVEVPKEVAPALPTDIDTDELTPGIPLQENYKKLKTKFKETKEALRTREAEYETTKKKLIEYETGIAVPETLQNLENENQKLRYFEKLHNLKMSPEYQENRVKPLNDIHSRIVEIAKDYDIPESEIPNFLNKAGSFKKTSELNAFLGDHFDNVGALEVKELLTKAANLRALAQADETEPAKALADMQVEHVKIKQVKDAERRNGIVSVSRDSWVNSLVKIQSEGKSIGLVRKEGDEEYNQKIVTPILTKAGQEYGKIVSALAEAGLERLPKEVGTAIANAVLLAHDSAVTHQSYLSLLEYVNELEKNTKRTTNYIRPQIGGGPVQSEVSSAPKAPLTSKDSAKQILNSIGVRY